MSPPPSSLRSPLTADSTRLPVRRATAQNAKKHHGVVMTAPASVKSVLLKFLENLILLRDNDELAACTRAEKRHRAKPIKDGGNNERELSTRQRQSLLERTGVWGKLLKHFEEAVRAPALAYLTKPSAVCSA